MVDIALCVLAGTEFGDEAAPGGPGCPGASGCGTGVLRLRPRCFPTAGEAAEPEERLSPTAEGGKREVSPRDPATHWGGEFGGGLVVRPRPRGDLLSTGGGARVNSSCLPPPTPGDARQLAPADALKKALAGGVVKNSWCCRSRRSCRFPACGLPQLHPRASCWRGSGVLAKDREPAPGVLCGR